MGGVFLTNVPRHCYIGLSENCQVSFVSTDYFSHESERLEVDSNYSRFHLSEHFARACKCFDLYKPVLFLRVSIVLLHLPPHLQGCHPLREHVQQLACQVEAQAYHCCLLTHVLLLLCHCEAFTHADQLRKTPAMRSLPVSLCVLRPSRTS